jgi:hypothetical protein
MVERALHNHLNGPAHVIDLPFKKDQIKDFVNGSISASIRPEQPQWIYAHEAVILSLPVSLD